MATNENTREFHESVFNKMGTEEFRNDLIALLRIRSPLIYLVCNEEKRMLTFFKHLSIAQGYKTYVWDCFLGIQDIISNQPTSLASEDMKDPEVILDHIIKSTQQDKQNAESMEYEGIKGNIYILLDYHRFLQDAMPGLERRLKQITKIEKRFTSVILVGPSFISTPSLEDYFRVIDFPFPNKEEISNVLMSLATDDKVTLKIPTLAAEAKKEEDELIKAVNGLTLNDAQDAFTKSIVKFKKFHIPTILKEKQQIIRKRGILEYYEPHVNMSNVGGLKNLVNWLQKRKLAFASDAESYGLRSPRGIMLIGTTGCGKSLVAKAVSSLYEMPLLRLDFGKLFNSLVGESERAARDAIKLAEAISPCCLWSDEIEKGLSGTSSSGMTDGGTTSRVVSTFLTWLQEKEKPVFLICTANNHALIPPEFMRAGRFDEIFFVDLPNIQERKEIYSVLLKKYKRDPGQFDLEKLADVTTNYSGAEIEKSIEISLFEGYSDKKREITTKDIIMGLSTFRPLAETRKEAIDEIRNWAKEKGCTMANDPETYSDKEKTSFDNLDLK